MENGVWGPASQFPGWAKKTRALSMRSCGWLGKATKWLWCSYGVQGEVVQLGHFPMEVHLSELCAHHKLETVID